MNGPYVRRMIPEPGDADREVPVLETFHEQTNDELTVEEIKQMEADDQVIQTILLGLPEGIYAAVDRLLNPVMNMSQETDADVGANGGNSVLTICWADVGICNPEWQIGVEYWDWNVVAARAEGKRLGNNGNQIKCYNYREMGHACWKCTVRRQKEKGCGYSSDSVGVIAQKTKQESNSKRRQASTSGTHSDKAPVYDSDGSVENDSNVISTVFSMEQNRGTVEQHLAIVEETRAYFESLYNNLAIKVDKVNTVNHKLRETNADLTTKLARYKNQEKCFEISQEKYDKLERCYQKSVYQEQCLTKKINALHLSSGKQITTLNEEISNLSKQLSTEKSTVSSLLEEKKKLKSDFKIREDELLDKQIQLENKIKELDNILVKTGQSIQTMHMLSPKPDSFYHTEQKMALGYQNPFYLKQAQRKHQCLYDGKVLLEKHDPPVVHDSEETMQLAQESRQKMKQLNKEIKPANYTKINHLSGVFVSQTAKSQEEVYLVNTSKMATVSKSISIPNEEFLDDTTLKAAKFVRDFKSLAKEADESLAKHKTLELEIERLLRAVVCQDIMSIVQNPSVVDSPNLQTELDRTKERLENCIIKKENEYAKLWNDWYKKCEECKYDKISYDKAYNDMQQKIERLQAQLGDLKGKSQDTPCVSNTLDPLSQKLENENVELEFQVRNYEKEIAHLKTTYKNLFDSISVTRTQTKAIIDSLQDKLHDTIYENAKLRAQLFDKVSDQKDTNKGTSANTKFAKQSILGKPPSSSRFPKVGETNALSKPVTSNSVPSSRESTVVNNERVIAPGIFRINPFKASRNDVNSKTNGFSPKDIRSTTRTRRPKPWNNPKSDKVPFKSKSGCLSNKLEKIEENHRSLQSSHYPNHTSSECNNIKLAFRNEKSEGPKKDLLDLKGKIIASSESESQSDCSKGCQNWFDTLLIPLLSEYNLKDKEDHGDNECDT
ncbi:hypothetical protein Tco_1201625 [Tanacetum coccineum]